MGWCRRRGQGQGQGQGNCSKEAHQNQISRFWRCTLSTLSPFIMAALMQQSMCGFLGWGRGNTFYHVKHTLPLYYRSESKKIASSIVQWETLENWPKNEGAKTTLCYNRLWDSGSRSNERTNETQICVWNYKTNNCNATIPLLQILERSVLSYAWSRGLSGSLYY